MEFCSENSVPTGKLTPNGRKRSKFRSAQLGSVSFLTARLVGLCERHEISPRDIAEWIFRFDEENSKANFRNTTVPSVPRS